MLGASCNLSEPLCKILIIIDFLSASQAPGAWMLVGSGEQRVRMCAGDPRPEPVHGGAREAPAPLFPGWGSSGRDAA